MYEILGYRSVTGTSKSTGNAYSGLQLYVCSNIKGVEGVATDRVYIPDRVLNDSDFVPCVGAHIDILYNRFGSVIEVKTI